MGYYITLTSQDEIVLARASCSDAAPDQQRETYGFCFLDCLAYAGPEGEPYIGDPKHDWKRGDARGSWIPDWDNALEVLEILERESISDEYTQSRLPTWRVLIEVGKANPDAFVTWDF